VRAHIFFILISCHERKVSILILWINNSSCCWNQHWATECVLSNKISVIIIQHLTYIVAQCQPWKRRFTFAACGQETANYNLYQRDPIDAEATYLDYSSAHQFVTSNLIALKRAKKKKREETWLINFETGIIPLTLNFNDTSIRKCSPYVFAIMETQQLASSFSHLERRKLNRNFKREWWLRRFLFHAIDPRFSRLFSYGAKKVSRLRAVKTTGERERERERRRERERERERRGERGRERERSDVGRNCRYRRNGDGIIFTLLKRAMTVDDSERTHTRTRAPGILPIQLPVSG